MVKDYLEKFQEYVNQFYTTELIVPKAFIQLMKTNLSLINFETLDTPILDKRNPLMVVVGDSVSCGHFEDFFSETSQLKHSVSDCYVEKFRLMLCEKYPFAYPSLINSSLAGDNIANILKRLERDVISHQPDLVIFNATLNWSKNRGSLKKFEESVREFISLIQSNTQADIMLMTPNHAIQTESDQTLNKRVEIIRNLATEYNLPLVDVYQMWSEVVQDDDIISLLANQMNHPIVELHTITAKLLMKYF